MNRLIWIELVLPQTRELAYHLRQYDEPYRSTVHMADFIRATVRLPLEGTVIDFGCGAGANIHWLTQWGVFGGARVVGMDQDADLIAIARERNPRATFLHNDISQTLWGADFSLSLQTLSFVEDWRPLLDRMIAHTAKWAFVSSLFWDGIETHTHVGDKHYNVIDAHSFEEFAKRYRAQEIRWYSPPVDKTLHAEPGKMGTYTKHGVQFSGPLLMPWRFAAIRMGNP